MLELIRSLLPAPGSWSGGRHPTFHHGVHPLDHKEATRGLAIERMPFVGHYVLPLRQHLGAPSIPVVEAGERVERGQTLATADGFVSVALHAPATGTVRAIEPRPHPSGRLEPAIVVDTDPFSSQHWSPQVRPHGRLRGDELVAAVQAAGLVGLGGAAFPSHVKLQVPEGKTARFVILNGCECEPYLTCDHRLMLERPRAVIDGLVQMMDHVGAERGYVGVEDNKSDAAEVLRQAVAECLGGAGDPRPVEVVELEVKYPQGAEKLLIDAILHREVPAGGLPLDLEILVHNVGTAAALHDVATAGQPLVERIVTVAGSGIRRPANLLVPIGTPLAAILEYCGGLRPETRQVVLGGPMMGQAQKDLEAPLTKGTSGILASVHPALSPATEQPCIRCGRCLEACPMYLNPTRLAELARCERLEDLDALHVLDCFECASCSFVCPSNIPLVHLIRTGKAMVRQQQTKSRPRRDGGASA